MLLRNKKRSSTLPETGVKGTGPIQVQAVGHWFLAEVNHLVEAKLSTID